MSNTEQLLQTFLSNLTPAMQERICKISNLESLLNDIFENARAAWPHVLLSAEIYLSYVARKLSDHPTPEHMLLELKASDLYLACACAQKNPEGLATFQKQYMPEIQAALHKIDPTSKQVDDLKQIIYEKLFLGNADHPPKISLYSGRGDLRSWLSVTAAREAIDLFRKVKHEVPINDSVLIDRTDPDCDLELSYLKNIYREEFKQAFKNALASLSTRERNILRYHLLDGLNIDHIGAIYNVHRATIARWLSKTREKLFQETRQALMHKLKVDSTELESIMRLIKSRMDVSIVHCLKNKSLIS